MGLGEGASGQIVQPIEEIVKRNPRLYKIQLDFLWHVVVVR